ncbi:TetR/AcrR family transcriptional regulator [Sutcliffiella halmapala]
MPKIVDHEKQKQLVAEAVWRIIRKEGMEGATVRKIAEEAGVSAGSLRHYFGSQSELLAFSMGFVSQKVKDRISGLTFTGDSMEDAQKLLYEFLPLDEEKSAEMEVWMAFTIKALSDSTLKELSSRVYEEMKMAITLIIDTLIEKSLAKEEIDRDAQIEILYALVDGLALHGIMQPNQVNAEVMKRSINHYLGSICRY